MPSRVLQIISGAAQVDTQLSLSRRCSTIIVYGEDVQTGGSCLQGQKGISRRRSTVSTVELVAWARQQARNDTKTKRHVRIPSHYTTDFNSPFLGVYDTIPSAACIPTSAGQSRHIGTCGHARRQRTSDFRSRERWTSGFCFCLLPRPGIK